MSQTIGTENTRKIEPSTSVAIFSLFAIFQETRRRLDHNNFADCRGGNCSAILSDKFRNGWRAHTCRENVIGGKNNKPETTLILCFDDEQLLRSAFLLSRSFLNSIHRSEEIFSKDSSLRSVSPLRILGGLNRASLCMTRTYLCLRSLRPYRCFSSHSRRESNSLERYVSHFSRNLRSKYIGKEVLIVLRKTLRF